MNSLINDFLVKTVFLELRNFHKLDVQCLRWKYCNEELGRSRHILHILHKGFNIYLTIEVETSGSLKDTMIERIIDYISFFNRYLSKDYRDFHNDFMLNNLLLKYELESPNVTIKSYRMKYGVFNINDAIESYLTDNGYDFLNIDLLSKNFKFVIDNFSLNNFHHYIILNSNPPRTEIVIEEPSLFKRIFSHFRV